MTMIPETTQRQLGIHRLQPKDQMIVIAKLEDMIRHRVTLELIQEVEPDKRDRLRELLEQGNRQELQRFLDPYIETNKELVGRAISQSIQEFQEASNAIQKDSP